MKIKYYAFIMLLSFLFACNNNVPIIEFVPAEDCQNKCKDHFSQNQIEEFYVDFRDALLSDDVDKVWELYDKPVFVYTNWENSLYGSNKRKIDTYEKFVECIFWIYPKKFIKALKNSKQVIYYVDCEKNYDITFFFDLYNITASYSEEKKFLVVDYIQRNKLK